MLPNQKIVIEAKNISVHASSHQILTGINFFACERELVSIVGPSGGGKSTLLKVLNRLADLDNNLIVKGQAFFQGKNIFKDINPYELRKKVGLVFQKPCIFPGSILRNVLFGIRHHQHIKRSTETEIAELYLRKAHLWDEVKDRLHHPATQLSLGQKQRLAFSRVLAVDPDVFLLDEPTSSLDPHSTQEIERALLEMKNTKSIVLVTHLLEQSRRISDRVVFMSKGRIIEGGNTKDLFERPRHEETKLFVYS